MKSLLLFLLLLFLFAACNEPAPATATDEKTPASTETLNYPYTTDHPGDNWEIGDPKHSLMVLTSLKAYENGNIDECIKAFADSVSLAFDNYEARVSKDTLKAIFGRERSQLKSFKVDMDDWESVISKDKKDEWVSLWYKQVWEDGTGKVDSLDVMDDLKIVNGKIAVLDQKVRHFAAKK